jgi:hypothetical protein
VEGGCDDGPLHRSAAGAKALRVSPRQPRMHRPTSPPLPVARSSFTDTGGVDLFQHIVVTRDGVAASVAGGVVGGLVGAPLGAAAGVFAGLANAAVDTVTATSRIATYRITAQQAWTEVAQGRLAELQSRIAGMWRQATASGPSASAGSVTLAPTGEPTLALRVAVSTPAVMAFAWFNGAAAPRSGTPTAAFADLAAALERCRCPPPPPSPATRGKQGSAASGEADDVPAVTADSPPAVMALAGLEVALSVASRDGFRVDAEGVAACQAVLAESGRATPWLRHAQAAADKAGVTLRRSAGVVEDESAGYDDAAVVAARMGLGGLGAGELKAPTSVMGLARLAGKAANAAREDAMTGHSLEVWLEAVREHRRWLQRWHAAAPPAACAPSAAASTWQRDTCAVTFAAASSARDWPSAAASRGFTVFAEEPLAAPSRASAADGAGAAAAAVTVDYVATREQVATALAAGATHFLIAVGPPAVVHDGATSGAGSRGRALAPAIVHAAPLPRAPPATSAAPAAV